MVRAPQAPFLLFPQGRSWWSWTFPFLDLLQVFVHAARRQKGYGYWDGAYRPWCAARGVERLMTRCSRWYHGRGAPTHWPALVECACDRVSTSWRNAGVGVPALLARASTSVVSRMLIVCAFLLGGYV